MVGLKVTATMEPLPFAPDATEANHRHDHHHDHTAENGEQPATDPITVIEEALARLVDDVGVLAEDAVVQAFAELKTPTWPVTCACVTQPKWPTAPAR